MAIKIVELNDIYQTKGSTNDIKVDVTIGDGQEGSFSVFFDSKYVTPNPMANIGKRADVIGKETSIVVVIADELGQTNHTSMTVFVYEGNSSPTKFGPYSSEAENHLDTVIYNLKLDNV
jgi:hypothetical protein